MRGELVGVERDARGRGRGGDVVVGDRLEVALDEVRGAVDRLVQGTERGEERADDEHGEPGPADDRGGRHADPAARLSSPPAQSMRGHLARTRPPRPRGRMPRRDPRRRRAGRRSAPPRLQWERARDGRRRRGSRPRHPLAEGNPVQNVTLTREQAAVFQAIEGTREHVFVTGRAGTGKSTLLNHLNWHTQKQIVICAPTGVAALNVGGQTIHSLFRLPIGVIADHDIDQNDTVRKILNAMDTLVIDEVSMVNADLMDAHGPLAAPGAPAAARAVRRRAGRAVRRPVPARPRARQRRRAPLLRRHLHVDVVLRREGVARGRPAHLRARRGAPPARRRVQAHAQRRAARRGHGRDRGRAERRGRAPAAARAGRDHARHHERHGQPHQPQRSCTGCRGSRSRTRPR